MAVMSFTLEKGTCHEVNAAIRELNLFVADKGVQRPLALHDIEDCDRGRAVRLTTGQYVVSSLYKGTGGTNSSDDDDDDDFEPTAKRARVADDAGARTYRVLPNMTKRLNGLLSEATVGRRVLDTLGVDDTRALDLLLCEMSNKGALDTMALVKLRQDISRRVASMW
jgi:hypothetical protein